MGHKEQRRRNRKQVLEALHDETGSWGGTAAQARVRAFCAAPEVALTEDFAFVGALPLSDFYVDPAKPNASERRALWQNVRTRLSKPIGSTPGGWGCATRVYTLQALAEETQ